MLLRDLGQQEVADHPSLGRAVGAGHSVGAIHGAGVAGGLALEKCQSIRAGDMQQRFALQSCVVGSQVGITSGKWIVNNSDSGNPCQQFHPSARFDYIMPPTDLYLKLRARHGI